MHIYTPFAATVNGLDYVLTLCLDFMSFERYISDFAFSGCSSLQRVKLGEEATHVGDAAFSGCSALLLGGMRSYTYRSMTSRKHHIYKLYTSYMAICIYVKMT